MIESYHHAVNLFTFDQQSQCPLANLPPEMLEIVLRLLKNNISALLALMSTCKKFAFHRRLEFFPLIDTRTMPFFYQILYSPRTFSTWKNVAREHDFGTVAPKTTIQMRYSEVKDLHLSPYNTKFVIEYVCGKIELCDTVIAPGYGSRHRRGTVTSSPAVAEFADQQRDAEQRDSKTTLIVVDPRREGPVQHVYFGPCGSNVYLFYGDGCMAALTDAGRFTVAGYDVIVYNMVHPFHPAQWVLSPFIGRDTLYIIRRPRGHNFRANSWHVSLSTVSISSQYVLHRKCACSTNAEFSGAKYLFVAPQDLFGHITHKGVYVACKRVLRFWDVVSPATSEHISEDMRRHFALSGPSKIFVRHARQYDRKLYVHLSFDGCQLLTIIDMTGMTVMAVVPFPVSCAPLYAFSQWQLLATVRCPDNMSVCRDVPVEVPPAGGTDHVAADAPAQQRKTILISRTHRTRRQCHMIRYDLLNVREVPWTHHIDSGPLYIIPWSDTGFVAMYEEYAILYPWLPSAP